MKESIKYYFGNPLPEKTLNEIIEKFENLVEPINLNNPEKIFWNKSREIMTLSGSYHGNPEIINYSTNKNYLEFFRGQKARNNITEILNRNNIKYRTSKLEQI